MTITELIDKQLNFWESKGGNFCFGDELPNEMATGNYFDKEENLKFWHPVKSYVTDSEIEALEIKLGATLPSSFKALLKHKHYIELHFGDISLISHVPQNWNRAILQAVFDGWPKEHLIEKGYLPFAEYSDWGLLCFDLNKEEGNGEYPVILWDHETTEKYKPFASDLESALLKELTKKTT